MLLGVLIRGVIEQLPERQFVEQPCSPSTMLSALFPSRFVLSLAGLIILPLSGATSEPIASSATAMTEHTFFDWNAPSVFTSVIDSVGSLVATTQTGNQDEVWGHR